MMIRNLVANCILVFTSLALSLFAAEIAVRFALFDKFERSEGAQKFFERYYNSYGRSLKATDNTGCVWSDRITAHPYFGWVGKTHGKCVAESINRRGLFGREVGLEKDESKFNILIVGGSVAAHLASGSWRGKIWLEDILNRDYVSPNGKPFAVVNGSFGGWKYPAQNISVVMFGHGVDAVVAVDGFNEALNNPMDIPDVGLFMRLTREGTEESRLINFRTLKAWYEFCIEHRILTHSFLAASVFRYQVGEVEKSWGIAKSESPYAEYSFPEDWGESRKQSWNSKQLKYYIRLLSIESKGLGLKFAHFMQPIPAYLKPLTKEETDQLAHVTEDKYKELLKASEELAREGIATFSLAGIFDGITERIYADEIHCQFDYATGDSKGYRMMSEKMASIIAKEWRLRRK